MPSLRTLAIVLSVMVVAAVATMFLVALVQLRTDLPPKGPACDYELEPMSGGYPGGVERIEWGLTPDRTCEVVAGPLAGRRFTGTADDLAMAMGRFLAGVAAGVVVGGAAVVRLGRRRASAQVSGATSPA